MTASSKPPFAGEARRVRLGDVCEVEKADGSASDTVWLLNLEAVEKNTGRVMWRELAARSSLGASTIPFTADSVLYSKLRPNLNKVVLPDSNGFATSEMIPLKPDASALKREYLALFLRSGAFVSYAVESTAGAKMPRVSRRTVLNAEVPLPSISEQESAIRRFEQINSLELDCERQLSLLDDLVKSRFVEMFGDPAENPFGYRVASLGETLSVQPTNGLYKPQKDYVADGSGTPIIRIDSFNEHGPNYARLRRLNCSDGELARYGLANGDIVVNRVNSVGCMGKTMLVEGLSEPVVFESNMMRLHVEEALMSPAFLCAQMTSEYSKGYFESHAKRAIGQASINQTDVKALPVLVPSLVLQREYLSFADAVAKSQFVGRTARDCLNCYVRAMRLTAERGRCPCFSSNRLK